MSAPMHMKRLFAILNDPQVKAATSARRSAGLTAAQVDEANRAGVSQSQLIKMMVDAGRIPPQPPQSSFLPTAPAAGPISTEGGIFKMSIFGIPVWMIAAGGAAYFLFLKK